MPVLSCKSPGWGQRLWGSRGAQGLWVQGAQCPAWPQCSCPELCSHQQQGQGVTNPTLLGWKNHLAQQLPAVPSTKPCPKCHMNTSHHTFRAGHPTPSWAASSGEEVFPKIQPKTWGSSLLSCHLPPGRRDHLHCNLLLGSWNKLFFS